MIPKPYFSRLKCIFPRFANQLMIMKSQHSFLIIVALLLLNFSLIAQTATNIDVSTSDDKMIIAYDLEGKSDEVYNVQLIFKKEDGTLIQPQSIKGDYGKVITGEGKAIIWEVYKDLDELSGKIEPEIIVSQTKVKNPKPTVQPTPKPPTPSTGSTNNPNSNNKNGNTKVVDVIDNLFAKYKFGFKVGIGNSNAISNRRPNDFTEGFSYEVGGFFRWNPHRKIYLQPEIVYHQQLYQETLTTLIPDDQFSENRNHYLRGQLIGGVKPFGLGLYFNAGLYYGRLLGGNEKVFLEDITLETNHFDVGPNNGIDNPYRKNDAGYIIGGTMSFFKGAFAVGVLYSRGFDSFIDPAYFADVENYNNWSKVNESFHFYISKSF